MAVLTDEAPRRRMSAVARREAAEAYGFLLPNLLWLLAFTTLPIIASFLLSFTTWDLIGERQWVGLANYGRLLFDDDDFRTVLGNTVYYTIVSVPLGMTVSLVLALLLNQQLRGVVFFRTAFFAPVVTSTVAVALAFRLLYQPDFGLVNVALRNLGILGPLNALLTSMHKDPLIWLGSKDWAMLGVILMSVWKGMGYNMMIFLAGLQGIPQHLYEAAAIDGAGRWQRFRNITLPLLSPTTFFVLIISVIGSFQVFDQAFIMTQGGPGDATTTLVYYIYNNAFQFFKMGYAAAVAWVLFAIVFVFTLLQVRLQNRWVHY